MMRAHQPGSRPLDIPEAIPNPAVPQTTPSPSPSPREPVKVPAPQRALFLARIILRGPCTVPRGIEPIAVTRP
jgi:hypothetical protein